MEQLLLALVGRSMEYKLHIDSHLETEPVNSLLLIISL